MILVLNKVNRLFVHSITAVDCKEPEPVQSYKKYQPPGSLPAGWHLNKPIKSEAIPVASYSEDRWQKVL
jgi:hypothetical protein